jgi:hypothetical protein
MAGDQHHLAGLQREQRCRRAVDGRLGLVRARELGRDHAVKAQVAVAGEVDEQRDVPV